MSQVVESSKSSDLLDNALVGSSVIPGIAAVLSRAAEVFAEDAVDAAIDTCMRALSRLANAGVGVRRAIIQCESVVPALLGVLESG